MPRQNTQPVGIARKEGRTDIKKGSKYISEGRMDIKEGRKDTKKGFQGRKDQGRRLPKDWYRKGMDIRKARYKGRTDNKEGTIPM